MGPLWYPKLDRIYKRIVPTGSEVGIDLYSRLWALYGTLNHK